MSGELVTGGLAAFLAFWILMSGLEGLGYAFPVRPSLIVPERWARGAQVLFWIIIIGLAVCVTLPLLFGAPPRVSIFHFLLAAGLVLPVWEILAARVYDDCFVIINAHESVIRPIVLASLNRVFGEVYEDKDMIRAAYKSGEDWQVITHEKEHLLALDPVFKVEPHRRFALERDIQTALHDIEPAGFNERSFWISFVTPLCFALVYAAIAFYLLKRVSMQPLH